MADSLTIDFDRPVALFPLPQCVLLPHATIPLLIFEPRYRRMVADAMESTGLIAMAAFEGDSWKRDYEGAPPLRPCVCVGYIVRCQTLEDGRSNIFLQGLCRARIRREVKHSPYRLALLEPTEPQPVMDIDLTDQRQEIESLLADPLLSRLKSVCAVHRWLSADVPTGTLIDLLIMNLTGNLEQLYALLAEPDAAARAKWLQRYLVETRRTIEAASRQNIKTGQLEVTLN